MEFRIEDPRDEHFMHEALKEAYKAFKEDEVPVGAIIVCNDKIIGRGYNLTERLNDVTAHAEMIALTAASENMNGKYLSQCTMYVTVEPCIMCAGALGWSQIGRLVYGAPDSKRGFLKFCDNKISPLHPRTLVTGNILGSVCGELMKEFFRKKR